MESVFDNDDGKFEYNHVFDSSDESSSDLSDFDEKQKKEIISNEKPIHTDKAKEKEPLHNNPNPESETFTKEEQEKLKYPERFSDCCDSFGIPFPPEELKKIIIENRKANNNLSNGDNQNQKKNLPDQSSSSDTSSQLEEVDPFIPTLGDQKNNPKQQLPESDAKHSPNTLPFNEKIFEEDEDPFADLASEEENDIFDASNHNYTAERKTFQDKVKQDLLGKKRAVDIQSSSTKEKSLNSKQSKSSSLEKNASDLQKMGKEGKNQEEKGSLTYIDINKEKEELNEFCSKFFPKLKGYKFVIENISKVLAMQKENTARSTSKILATAKQTNDKFNSYYFFYYMTLCHKLIQNAKVNNGRLAFKKDVWSQADITKYKELENKEKEDKEKKIKTADEAIKTNETCKRINENFTKYQQTKNLRYISCYFHENLLKEVENKNYELVTGTKYNLFRTKDFELYATFNFEKKIFEVRRDYFNN